MTTVQTVTGDLRINGDLILTGVVRPGVSRSSLTQEQLAEFPLRLTDFRVWDALATNLPGTPATDDLGLIGGTFATGSPSIQTGDLKAAGATNRYARVLVHVPVEFDTATDMAIRLHAGMITTVAGVSATIDVQVFRSNDEAGIGADLCTTAAQSINSLTYADKDFTIDAITLSPGDVLDIRITIAVNDAATGTAVIGSLGKASLLCDIRG